MQQAFSLVRQGHHSSLSPFWLRLMAGSAQAGFDKPLTSSKCVRFAEGAPLRCLHWRLLMTSSNYRCRVAMCPA